MRKSLILLAATLSLQAFAADIRESVIVVDSNNTHLKDITSSGSLTVDHPTFDGYEVYGPKGMKKWLKKNSIPFYVQKENQKFWNNYPSFEKITKRLQSLAKKYPKIAKLSSIGKSVEGRELWVMKISDNVGTDEREPEVKYISSMHGDEITGRELMVEFIGDLLKKYGNDNEVTELINNTEIHIMASMNPDGSKMRRRHNANYSDLNRDFPDFTTSDNSNTQAGRQPETKAVMKFQDARNFVLSANFHGGAVVVNYPWDTKKEKHPMDKLVKEVSLEYASTNSEMNHSHRFPGGITNGYAWYHLDGGMQDWSYHWYGDLQVTIELSSDKWPSYSKIPSYYKDNYDSLLNYLRRGHQGTGFYFKGNKQQSGTVDIYSVEGTSSHKVGTFGFRHGEYFKVLEAGTYRMVVNPKNGESQTITTMVRDNLSDIPSNGNYREL